MGGFNWTAEAREAWTNRVVMQARRNALAYRFGNNASEGEIQTNKDYRVANPVVNIKTEERSARPPRVRWAP